MPRNEKNSLKTEYKEVQQKAPCSSCQKGCEQRQVHFCSFQKPIQGLTLVQLLELGITLKDCERDRGIREEVGADEAGVCFGSDRDELVAPS